MNILITLDSNYLWPLRVMLTSMIMNNPNETFDIYLMHSRLKDEEIEDLAKFIKKNNMRLHVVEIDDHYFNDAKVCMHYPKEMYYRLLAHKFLPQELRRILYLDPDILVLNPLRSFYETDLTNFMYAACCHKKFAIRFVNQLRFSAHKIYNYYNSGVLLINLDLVREHVNEHEIFAFVDKYHNRLILPDQDVLNALYSGKIKEMDEIYYNYDARLYLYYKTLTYGKCDMDYVINNTVFLHFCGKKKPWNKKYMSPFLSLYKHYEKCAKLLSE
ncbi:MAG: glycosyltransferase family 8 protein [Bacilli bacterium]|nr:glycosyltransferase family 8 protein [Bacilli bacterium]